MTSLVLENEPAAWRVVVTNEKLVVDLIDGRTLAIPLTWYPRLLHATDAERQNLELLGDGYSIEWPDLDEDIGVEGLLAGRRSGESEASLQQWLATRKRPIH